MIIKGLFSLFLHKNIHCGYSLESPQRGNFNEYTPHMLWVLIRITSLSTHYICFYGELNYP